MSLNPNDYCYETSGQCLIQPGAIVGLRYNDWCRPARLGDQVTIRSGTVVYADVVIGDDFQCGHNAVIREKTLFGDHIVVGSGTVIDGHCSIGDFVKIESNCSIPTHVTIGSRVFLGPNVTLTNDKYPQKMRDSYEPHGPVIEDGVTLGAGVVVLPGVVIGRGSFVAAGAVVTKSIPAMSMVCGPSGAITPLPEKLREMNTAKNWREYFREES